jgi:hypothetical protein
MDFEEARSHTRIASGPHLSASFRNRAITTLRLARHVSIAAALRHHARRPVRPANAHELLNDVTGP